MFTYIIGNSKHLKYVPNADHRREGKCLSCLTQLCCRKNKNVSKCHDGVRRIDSLLNQLNRGKTNRTNYAIDEFDVEEFIFTGKIHLLKSQISIFLVEEDKVIREKGYTPGDMDISVICITDIENSSNIWEYVRIHG